MLVELPILTTEMLEEVAAKSAAPKAKSAKSKRASAPANAKNRCLSYLKKCGDAISGNGGHGKTFHAACECFRFGLSDQQALEVMRWFNAEKTGGEPWSESELKHKLEDAKETVTAAGEFGCRLQEDHAGGTREQLDQIVAAQPVFDPEKHVPAREKRTAAIERSTVKRPRRPNILMDPDEHRCIAETIQALASDTSLYQRGGVLVRTMRDPRPDDGILRADGSSTIQAVPAASLRERMTRCATFTKIDRQGCERRAHPAPWLVAGVHARGEWPGIRLLTGISDAPILRRDGTVWQTPGYDPRTGVLYEPGASVFPPVVLQPTIDDAIRAKDRLLDVVCDFSFERPEHLAAWLASLMTPLARFAFTGPSPLFAIDANVRGAGKGLLAQTIGWIDLGREMPVSSYSHDSEEMRKKITAIAIAGDRLILLDNLEGVFGNDALDRALTSTWWKDRILGKSEEVELPLIPVWFATGNNIQVAADTARRIIHIRMDVLAERPEERTGFKHPNLLRWISQERARLLTDALTILAAHCYAGRPKHDLTPFGSFEGWSDVVREAVVWVGLPDPCLTRARMAEQSDTTAEALGQFISALRKYDPFGQGIVVSALLNRLYPSERQYAPNDEAAIAMRAALENLVGCPPGRVPTAKQVGNKLRYFRRRVIGGCHIEPDLQRNENGTVWRLRENQ